MLIRKLPSVLAGLLFAVVAAGVSCEPTGEGNSVAGKVPSAAALGAAKVPAMPAPTPLPPRKIMPRSTKWSEVAQLTADQKFEEARRVVAAIRQEAQKTDNAADATEALINEVQLQIGLSGYETAVRFLRAEPWPKDLLSQASLELYYAHALSSYRNAYSWEIGQREKVEVKGAVDLKAWTSEQIYAEVLKAYARVWTHRDELLQQPLAELKPFLNPGTYPDAVRGTLRDAVSYLLVGELANTASWRPEQSDELSHLDVSALLRTEPAAVTAIQIDDPATHPVVKLNAVLLDLEAWHQKRDAKEAALEAKLQRLAAAPRCVLARERAHGRTRRPGRDPWETPRAAVVGRGSGAARPVRHE